MDTIELNGKRYELREIVDEPKPAPLRYKVGDVVLIPARVIEVDGSEDPYFVEFICDTSNATWITRAALEGDPDNAPKVGDRCVFWDDGQVGTIRRIDNGTPFRYSDSLKLYKNAAKLP
jgi:hypothetical protein